LHDDNPKKYWQLINELQGKSQNQNGNCISDSDWTSHFKNMNEVKEKFKDRIKEIDQNVKQLEQEHCFNELDFATTESEIAKTIAQFKINKSPGIDFISNSMYDNKFYITNSVMFFKICQCLS
jgi:two-component sensor histidine kinase